MLLFERYFYFLETLPTRKTRGLIVVHELDKSAIAHPSATDGRLLPWGTDRKIPKFAYRARTVLRTFRFDDRRVSGGLDRLHPWMGVATPRDAATDSQGAFRLMPQNCKTCSSSGRNRNKTATVFATCLDYLQPA